MHGQRKAPQFPLLPRFASDPRPVWIKAAHGKMVIKNKFCRFKAQAVIPLVGPVFLLGPRPFHAVSMLHVVTLL
jgi:hypothetical protein